MIKHLFFESKILLPLQRLGRFVGAKIGVLKKVG